MKHSVHTSASRHKPLIAVLEECSPVRGGAGGVVSVEVLLRCSAIVAGCTEVLIEAAEFSRSGSPPGHNLAE